MNSMFLSIEPSLDAVECFAKQGRPEIASYAMIHYSGGLAESQALSHTIESNLSAVQDILRMEPVPAARALTEFLRATTHIQKLVVAPIPNLCDVTIHFQ